MPTIKIEPIARRDKIAKADLSTLQGRWDSKLPAFIKNKKPQSRNRRAAFKEV